MRYHKINLYEPPDLWSAGIHGMDRETTEWSQPNNRYVMLHLWHPGTLFVNGVAHPFGPDTRFVVAPRSRCRIERSEGGENLQFWSNFLPFETKTGEMAVPFQSSFEDRSDVIKRNASRAIDVIAYNRGYTRALTWELLWSIAEEPGLHTYSLVVARAQELIEAGIGEKLRIQDLARELMVSHNHLTRQFVRELGVTPQEYIRNMRLSIAVRLLTTTTTPIKRIAARVGVPDLKQFNRLVRDRLGFPPRTVRKSQRILDANVEMLRQRVSERSRE
ncbi:MAG TPA: AraC family transcriptional regulator [Fimbriimonadaceae bacterium]|nr:AraC family transcriptional regulator [Fimbriimonadaceae bacterium]